MNSFIMGIRCGAIVFLMLTIFSALLEYHDSRETPGVVSVKDIDLPSDILREVLDITRGDLS